MKKILCILLGIIPSSLTYCQEVFGTNGGHSYNADEMVAYTLGQPFIQSFTDQSCIYSEGFQQGVFLQIEDKIKQACIVLYPNPAHNTVNIKATSADNVYELYDIKGQLVLTHKSDYLVEEIALDHMANGIYILKATTSAGQYQVTKLILQ